ncbi:MAG TPA: MoaD/ThiS family protein [Ginsengibacter sp.]|nr:MoaD/ThiS family protein [Ginsengibacter sp.]
MKILAFGIVKDIFNNSMIDVTVENESTIDILKKELEAKYPRLGQLGSYMVAINNEYASDDDVVNAVDEIAIIPPVSGG